MQYKKVQFISPEFPASELIAKDYETIHANNWYTNFGPFERHFSKEINQYIGQDIDVATASNATSGLMLAMMALLPQPKGERVEVIMPAFTFAAGADCLLLLGYTPVFIDIELETLQPDAVAARSYIQKNPSKIAGLLFCNIFGVGAPTINDWEALAADFDLPLIIDSAAGFGSCYPDGSLLGARGDCEVFSFHATKPFAIGEGGAVTSRNKELITTIRETSNFGFSGDRMVHNLGVNAKLQELNCAIGLHQLETLNDKITFRQDILAGYKKALEPHGYVFQANDDKSSVVFASVLAPTADTADAFHDRLGDRNVEAHRYYNPHLAKHPALKDRAIMADDLAVTEDVCSRIISLPVHRHINEETIAMIAQIAAA